MTYPTKLLPKKNYKTSCFKNFPDNFSLMRKVDKDIIVEDKFGGVTIEAIIGKPEEIYGYSITLYGKCNEDDLKYSVKANDDKKWTRCSKPPKLDEFPRIFFEEIQIIYLIAHEIHNLEFPITKKISKKGNDNILRFNGIVKLEHKPLRSNYWHFEINVYENEGDSKPIKKGNNDWKRESARGFIKTTMKDIFSSKQPDSKIKFIPFWEYRGLLNCYLHFKFKEFYKKNPTKLLNKLAEL